MAKHRIVYTQDESCNMEKLEVDGVCVGYGNTEDNHCSDRLDAIEKVFDHLGFEYTIKELHQPYDEWE